MFCSQILIGQTKTENKKGTTGMATGAYKPNRQQMPPANKSTNYESRNYQNDCYKSFAFTVKNYGYNKDGEFYTWGVSVKNNYTKAVQLKYRLIVGNDIKQNGTLTYYNKPGETYSNDFGKVKAIIVNNNSDQYKIEVSEVCFEGQDCVKNGYVDCNGRQSNNDSLGSKNEIENNPAKNYTSSEKPLNGSSEKILKDGTKIIYTYKNGKVIEMKWYDAKTGKVNLQQSWDENGKYTGRTFDENGNIVSEIHK